MTKLVFVSLFITALVFVTTSTPAEAGSRCSLEHKISDCAAISVDPTLVFGAYAALIQDSPELQDWYHQMETEVVFQDLRFGNIARLAYNIVYNRLVDGNRYQFTGSFMHHDACDLYMTCPTDAYDYLYYKSC